VPPRGEVEVETFGLLPDHSGQGIGGHFRTGGVRLAWTVAPAVSRVWLHTTSRDHCHALADYEGCGFRRCQVLGEPDASVLTKVRALVPATSRRLGLP
jgi:GNAT superfamily N-acetyltransferase